MSARISILLACDQTLTRAAFAHWLGSNGEFSVVASVVNAAEAVEAARRLCPDLVVLDTVVPDFRVFEAARAIRAEAPGSRIVLLNACFQDRHIEQALAVKASGYLTKTESPELFRRVLKSIAAGSTYYSPEIRGRMSAQANGAQPARPGRSRASTLTRRELEILCHLARGLPKKRIAQMICLSLPTVNRHAANLMAKLDIHDRVELARFAIREGLVEP